MKVLQLMDAGNLCVSGSSIDRTFLSLFPEFEDLVGNLVVKVLQEVNQHKLTIQLRLLKIMNDTASLNNASAKDHIFHLDRSIQGKYDEQRLSKLFYAVINTI